MWHVQNVTPHPPSWAAPGLSCRRRQPPAGGAGAALRASPGSRPASARSARSPGHTMFLGGGPLAQTSHCPFLGPRVGAEPSGRLWSRPGGVSTAAPSPAAALPGPATRALVVGGPCVSPPLEAGGTGKRGPLLSGGLKRPPVGMVSRKGGGGEGPPGPRGQGRVWGLVGQALCVSRGDH